jgi:hypothetical protein
VRRAGRSAWYGSRVTAADPDAPWDVRILRAIDSGVDESLVAERLKLTPTERIETMRQALLTAEDLRAAMRRATDGD